MQRLTAKQVAPAREHLLKKQNHRCALCNAPLHARARKDPVLDHCHDQGHIRGVLCRNCNQMEGKVKTSATRAMGSANRIEWLSNLLNYWREHAEPQTPWLHPTHKTEEEKRLARNKKARERRAKLKELQNK
jgi:hypothetical protein